MPKLCIQSTFTSRQEVFRSRMWGSITHAFQLLRPTVRDEGQASFGNREAPGSYRSSTSTQFIIVTVAPPPHSCSHPQSACPGSSPPCGLCCPVLCSQCELWHHPAWHHRLPLWHHRAAFMGKAEQQQDDGAVTSNSRTWWPDSWGSCMATSITFHCFSLPLQNNCYCFPSTYKSWLVHHLKKWRCGFGPSQNWRSEELETFGIPVQVPWKCSWCDTHTSLLAEQNLPGESEAAANLCLVSLTSRSGQVWECESMPGDPALPGDSIEPGLNKHSKMNPQENSNFSFFHPPLSKSSCSTWCPDMICYRLVQCPAFASKKPTLNKSNLNKLSFSSLKEQKLKPFRYFMLGLVFLIVTDFSGSLSS